MSLTQLHSVITVHTFNCFLITSPSRLSASCSSGFLEFSGILLLLPTSVCSPILSSLLYFWSHGFWPLGLIYLTLGRSRRHLLEGLCFAFSMQRSPSYWRPRFGTNYQGNCYEKLRSTGGESCAFRRRVAVLRNLYYRPYPSMQRFGTCSITLSNPVVVHGELVVSNVVE
jgi:hypothetical protein